MEGSAQRDVQVGSQGLWDAYGGSESKDRELSWKQEAAAARLQ